MHVLEPCEQGGLRPQLGYGVVAQSGPNFLGILVHFRAATKLFKGRFDAF